MPQPVILVVDDEPDNFDVIDAFLDGQGYELHYAADGNQALSSVELIHPDLILLDVMMPGQDGISVCQTLKKNPKWQTIPIIMVTALGGKEDLANCLNAGADDFISKPVNRLELKARVQSMLRIKTQFEKIQWFSTSQRNTINMLAENLNQLSQNIAHSFPHAINTPLNGLVGVVEVLQDGFEEMSTAEVRELLEILAEMTRCLETLSQKFLAYVELELETMPRPGLVNTHSTVIIDPEHLTQELLSQAGERKTDLSINLAPGILPLPKTYFSWLCQELLSNALKFSSVGSPVIVRAAVDQNSWVLTVQDYGRGMTKSQIASIKPFQQFDRVASDLPGIGLGLKIAQKVAEFAKGRLTIQSTYHQETTVTVTLPLASDP